MIDRREFFRRFGGAAAGVALAPYVPLLERTHYGGIPVEPVSTTTGFYGKPLVEDIGFVQTDLGALVHRVFTSRIVENIQQQSAMSRLFEDVDNHYALHGEKLVFSVDIK